MSFQLALRRCRLVVDFQTFQSCFLICTILFWADLDVGLVGKHKIIESLFKHSARCETMWNFKFSKWTKAEAYNVQLRTGDDAKDGEAQHSMAISIDTRLYTLVVISSSYVKKKSKTKTTMHINTIHKTTQVLKENTEKYIILNWIFAGRTIYIILYELNSYTVYNIHTVRPFKYVEGGPDREAGPGGSMKYQSVYLNVVTVDILTYTRKSYCDGVQQDVQWGRGHRLSTVHDYSCSYMIGKGYLI